MLTPLRKSFISLGVVGSAFGFIGDVLKPFADFGVIFLVASLVGIALSAAGLVYVRRHESTLLTKDRLVAASVFFGLFAVIWGMYIPLANAGPPQGYLANNIDAIATLQRDVLKIGQDVSEIKGSVKSIDGKVDNINAKIDNITARITQVDLNGGIIGQPRTPQEWYSNAVIYKLKGMNEDALRSFEKLFDYNLTYIDPYMQYLELARNVKGADYAGAFLTTLSAKYPTNETIQLMTIKSLPDRAARVGRYDKLYAKGDPSAPLLYLLIAEYAFANLPQPSMIDRQREVEYLDALAQVPANKQLREYFVSADQLVTAQTTIQTETNVNKMGQMVEMIKNPVNVNLYPAGNGEVHVGIRPDRFPGDEHLLQR